jgi:hypothetical protein
MQNEIIEKKEWQAPEVVDLDVKDSEDGISAIGFENKGGWMSSYCVS